MIAAEILMPRAIFDAALNHSAINASAVRRLAAQFHTSLTATVLRCADLRPLSVVSIHNGQPKWRRGPARPSDYQVKLILGHLVDGEPGDSVVMVERGALATPYRGEWLRTTHNRSGILLLTPLRPPR